MSNKNGIYTIVGIKNENAINVKCLGLLEGDDPKELKIFMIFLSMSKGIYMHVI